jgi:hypothetical protein
LFGHTALDFVGTSHGVDHAGELNESAVPCILDNAPAMIGDFWIKKRPSKSFQLRQRAFFIDPYQAARARDIRRQNSRQSPLYVLSAQDAPPTLGEIEWLYIAGLWADVRLCSCPKGGGRTGFETSCATVIRDMDPGSAGQREGRCAASGTRAEFALAAVW